MTVAISVATKIVAIVATKVVVRAATELGSLTAIPIVTVAVMVHATHRAIAIAIAPVMFASKSLLRQRERGERFHHLLLSLHNLNQV